MTWYSYAVLPAQWIVRFMNETLPVRLALAKISYATGMPISAFEDDALRWCNSLGLERANALEYAANEAAAGRLLPWVQERAA